jgi:hypothetical protein
VTKAKLVEIMRRELRRQFEEDDLGWYSEGDDFVAVDGNPDLEQIADAILKEMDDRRRIA